MAAELASVGTMIGRIAMLSVGALGVAVAVKASNKARWEQKIKREAEASMANVGPK